MSLNKILSWWFVYSQMPTIRQLISCSFGIRLTLSNFTGQFQNKTRFRAPIHNFRFWTIVLKRECRFIIRLQSMVSIHRASRKGVAILDPCYWISQTCPQNSPKKLRPMLNSIRNSTNKICTASGVIVISSFPRTNFHKCEVQFH